MNSKTQYIKYYKYVNTITKKRLKILMPLSFALLLILVFLDLSVRNSIGAVCTRLPSLALALSLIIINIFNIKVGETALTLIYNIFLSSILAMMFAKFLIHIEVASASINILGIIIAIFILSLEVRASLLNTIIIYLIPIILFSLSFYLFFRSYFDKDVYTPLINVAIFLIVGFFINKVQNNFRVKAFLANYLLNIERKKLKESNEELKIHKENLTGLVKEKTILLNNALKKSKESDGLKKIFLENISHEIRTPINIASGFIEILSNKDKEVKKMFKIINDNFNTLTKTIDDILFLSKLQTEEIKVKKNKFHSKDFINNAFSYLQNKLKESGKDITSTLDFNKYDSFLIKSNEEYLQKVLEHIIDNAIKFSNSGEIKLQCYKKEEKVILKISDEGQGISKENRPYVFDNFRKFEDENTIFRGVGIGLSITKKLIYLLSGKINIDSKIDIGTTVEIIINQK